jgi:hypothetical protein
VGKNAYFVDAGYHLVDCPVFHAGKKNFVFIFAINLITVLTNEGKNSRINFHDDGFTGGCAAAEISVRRAVLLHAHGRFTLCAGKICCMRTENKPSEL